MCLPEFKEFKNIPENEPLIGYRIWHNSMKDSLILKSQYQNYNWKRIEGPHEVKEVNSGIYAYNNYYNYYNNNYYNYNNNNYNNYYYYNNYYNNYNYNYNNYYNYLVGIILQWGKVAIHSEGQRSEFAKIKTLFSIRESDAQGPEKFLNWIKIFNERIQKIAQEYNANVISWQDSIESNKMDSESK